MEDPAYLGALRRLAAKARYVTSVCTGSLLLGAAGLLRGKRAACHWAWRELLATFEAIPDPARVVREGNLFTGGGVTAGIDMALTVVAEIAGPDFAQTLQLALEYAPDPPFARSRADMLDVVGVELGAKLLAYPGLALRVRSWPARATRREPAARWPARTRRPRRPGSGRSSRNFEHSWREHLHLPEWRRQLRRHDPDHLPRLPVELDRLADERRALPEPAASSWLTMHTAGPFGTSSAALKSRPRAGGMPSVLKNAPLTRWPFNCIGCSPLPVNVKLSNARHSRSSENDLALRSHFRVAGPGHAPAR